MSRTAEQLVAEADALCEAADEMIFSDKEHKARAPGRDAVRLYRAAARLSADPERGKLFLRAVEVAGALELRKTAVSLIREACRHDPDHETVEAMRDHWGFFERDAPFPEPPPANSLTLLDRQGPIPGQLTFLEALS
jgi:hypothetical protein